VSKRRRSVRVLIRYRRGGDDDDDDDDDERDALRAQRTNE